MVKVTGSILDNDERIIPYANIEVVGENTKGIASADGRFTILAASQNSLLRFSHAGYDYDEIKVKDFNDTGRIELYPVELSEVVITNNYKKNDNTIYWVLGFLGLTTIIGVATYSKPQKVKV